MGQFNRSEALRYDWPQLALRVRSEYEAALALLEPGDTAVRERLQGNLAQLALDRGPVQLAERTAARNGWLLFAVLGAVASAVAALWWRSRSDVLA